MASIGSIGIGSGVLTAEVIEQLREVDETQIVKPIENKITTNNQQQDAYKLLDSLMDTFKASASALSFSTIFDGKTVESTGKADIKIDSGAAVESFTLETNVLAKKDITMFGAVSSRNAPATTADGTLEIVIGSKTISIEYKEGMSLSELSQAITDQAGDDVSASILQTGDGAFNLVLTSKTTGKDQAMTITDSGGFSTDLTDTMKKVQEASDAEFTYNGIAMTRSTNEFSDLILGVDIKLKEEGDFSVVEVSQDTSAITDELQLFTDSYNALISNLHDMTQKDKETGAVGVFNGNSFIISIARDLTKTITSLSSNNDSLVNYGIDLDRYGKMSFNKATFEEKMTADPDGVETFFTGSLNSDGDKETDGLFLAIDEKLTNYTGYGKLLSNFETDLKTQSTSLSKNHAAAQASLDSKYEIMTKRFIAYDLVISRLNSQFSALQMMIDADSE